MPFGSNWSPRFAVFGDMGNENAQSVGRLQEETQNGKFDAILHVGLLFQLMFLFNQHLEIYAKFSECERLNFD
jgi:hypothetical protein